MSARRFARRSQATDDTLQTLIDWTNGCGVKGIRNRRRQRRGLSVEVIEERGRGGRLITEPRHARVCGVACRMAGQWRLEHLGGVLEGTRSERVDASTSNVFAHRAEAIALLGRGGGRRRRGPRHLPRVLGGGLLVRRVWRVRRRGYGGGRPAQVVRGRRGHFGGRQGRLGGRARRALRVGRVFRVAVVVGVAECLRRFDTFPMHSCE